MVMCIAVDSLEVYKCKLFRNYVDYIRSHCLSSTDGRINLF